jgi:peptidoglycan hydrolase-like protein with peptidoglycan-binding domain
VASTTLATLQSFNATLKAELATLEAPHAPTPTAPGITFTRTLLLGDRGTDVSALQQILEAQGFFTYPTVTGYFGPITEAALAAYQTARGLEPAGYAGPLTRALLNGLLTTKTGAAGEPSSTTSGASLARHPPPYLP